MTLPRQIRPLRQPLWPAGLLVAAACAVAAPARAAEADGAGGPAASVVGVGLAVGTRSRPYRDVDTETRLLPVLSYENRWLRVGGLGAELKLGDAGPLSFALGTRYALDSGYEADDAPILAGMAERESSWWIGPSVTWRAGLLNLTVEALGDASGHSEGRQFRLTLDRSFDSGAFRFTPRLSGIRRDAKFNDYYYGVRADEARADRPAYTATAGTDVEFGLRVNYRLAPQHLLFLDLSQTAYGSAVTRSPLVDESSATAARFGYLYRF